MKVLMFHNDYRLAGGETKSVRSEVANLLKQGVKVELAMRSTPASLGVRDAVDILLTGRSAADEAATLIRRFEPDVIHVQNIWPGWGHGLIQAIGNSGVPYVQTLRNYRWTCLSANHFRNGSACFDCSKAATAVSGVMHKCYRGSHTQSAALALHDVNLRLARSGAQPSAIILLSNEMRRVVAPTIPPLVPVVVKYNSLDPEPTPLNGEKSGMVWVGRLEQEKGFDLVSEAWLRWPSKIPFTIIGNGQLAASAQSLQMSYPDSVTWYPELNHHATIERIASSQFAVMLPRWSEPFGRVALECLSVGTPVLHSGRGALPEVVGDSGWAVDCDIETVVDQLDHCLVESAGLRVGARSRYEQSFSAAQTTRQLMRLYASVAEAEKPQRERNG